MKNYREDCANHAEFLRRNTSVNQDRRFFLRSGAVALAGVGLAHTTPSFIQRAVAAQGATTGRRKTLVAIFLRGAVDGVNMVVPYGESHYYDLRRTIAIPKPDGSAESAIDLDGFFGLHPAMRSLKPFWDSKRLGIVHAAGSPDATRSHFDAQDYMESGTPGRKSTPDGWLNRIGAEGKSKQASPFRLVSVTQGLPRSLQGNAPALAIPDLQNFTIRAGENSAGVQGGFEAIYEANANDALAGTGRETFEAVNYLKRVNPSQYKAANSAQYPRGKFGESLLQISQLIKADVGLEIAFTDVGGWDTHVNQGGVRGQLALRLGELAQGLSALATDLGTRMDDVVILTMSEFGRTIRENGTRGTDHGHANAMLVLGNTVRGGRVHGDFPGLAPDKLYEGRDLALTTDFRDVFGEVAAKHLGAKNLPTIFPGYMPQPAKFRGVLG
ncbi:MAG: DUF1501 domain-containing protein [Acidobacteriota bacterium]|nr:DUF1501 domain-containing protein [Acidobacteriota bacterium]